MTGLAIVIVNWNGGDLLLRCLNSIRASTCSAKVEVIVVDNHSDDGSRELATAAFPEFRVLDSGSNLGFGRANNLARNLVDAPLVLFLNPDTELMHDTLERALRCLSQLPDVGALGCRMLYLDGQIQELGLQWNASPWTVLFELLFVSGWTRRALRRWLPTVDPLRSGYVKKLYGGFMLVKREVLDAAGWFDERYFMYAEDADLSRTIVGLGCKLYYCSEAAIIHVGGGLSTAAPSTFGSVMKQESINRMIRKYQGGTATVLHRISVLIGCSLRICIGSAVGLVMVICRNGIASARWTASCVRHKDMMLWALCLKKACVPVWRTTEHRISVN